MLKFTRARCMFVLVKCIAERQMFGFLGVFIWRAGQFYSVLIRGAVKPPEMSKFCSFAAVSTYFFPSLLLSSAPLETLNGP